MSVPPLTADEQTVDPMHQEQEMAALLDNMILLAPTKVSENAQDSKEDSPKKQEIELTKDVAERHEDVSGPEADISEYDELCLIFGLVSSEKDISPHYDQETVFLDVFKQIYNDPTVYTDLHALLFLAVTVGNLTESQARQIRPVMMERIEKLMNSVGVKFTEISATRDTNELDFAAFAKLFPANTFNVLRKAKMSTQLQMFLPPEVSSRVPLELAFLHAGPLECVLLKESHRKKLRAVMTYLSDQFCEQLARETGHDREKIRLSVLRSQAVSSRLMEFQIEWTLSQCDLLDALSRVELPANSAVSSKKPVNDSNSVKGKPSNT